MFEEILQQKLVDNAKSKDLRMTIVHTYHYWKAMILLCED